MEASNIDSSVPFESSHANDVMHTSQHAWRFHYTIAMSSFSKKSSLSVPVGASGSAHIRTIKRRRNIDIRLTVTSQAAYVYATILRFGNGCGNCGHEERCKEDEKDAELHTCCLAMSLVGRTEGS